MLYLLQSRLCMPVLSAALPKKHLVAGHDMEAACSSSQNWVISLKIWDSQSFDMGHPAHEEEALHAGTSQLAANVGWRLSLGLTGLPAVVVLAGCLILPETPNSLMQRGREQEARRVSCIFKKAISVLLPCQV